MNQGQGPARGSSQQQKDMGAEKGLETSTVVALLGQGLMALGGLKWGSDQREGVSQVGWGHLGLLVPTGPTCI